MLAVSAPLQVLDSSRMSKDCLHRYVASRQFYLQDNIRCAAVCRSATRFATASSARFNKRMPTSTWICQTLQPKLKHMHVRFSVAGGIDFSVVVALLPIVRDMVQHGGTCSLGAERRSRHCAHLPTRSEYRDT